MQISGTTMGSPRAPSSAALNGKRKRQSSRAVSAPSATLTTVETAAMVSELPKAAIRSSSWNAVLYQSSVKPRQTMFRLLTLKLNAIRVISGA